jgi:hypothetical protein
MDSEYTDESKSDTNGHADDGPWAVVLHYQNHVISCYGNDEICDR